MRDDSQALVLLTSPFTNAATENGHHGTCHPSNVLAMWSASGNWSDVLAFGALDYSLASNISNGSGETH